MRSSVEDFDPNGADSPLWGVYNRGKFRTYVTRGAAINSFHLQSPAKLFELGENGWVLSAYRRETPQDRCDCCSKAIVPSDAARVERTYDHNTGTVRPMERWGWNYIFDRTPGGKIKTPTSMIFACMSCIKARP